MISIGRVTVQLVPHMLLVPCLVLLTSVTAQATPALLGSARDQAIVHFNEGNEAFRRGDTHEAYKQYQTAWQLHQTFDIACNLGRAEAELGKLPQAAGHLAYCLEHFSSSPQHELKDARQRYAELFNTVRAQVSSLSFDVDPNGAEVSVNGALVGTTPLERNVFVLPGTQLVELRLAGYHGLKREIPAAAGESRSLRLKLERIDPSSAPPAPAQAPDNGAVTNPSAEASESVSARTVALVTGTALTVAGAAVGLGFYLQGAKLDDEAAVLRQRIQETSGPNPNPCSTPGEATCSQLANTVDRRYDAWTVSTVGFVSMGVFGLGTLATWLWWPTKSTSAQSKHGPTLTPVVTSQLLGATVSGEL